MSSLVIQKLPTVLYSRPVTERIDNSAISSVYRLLTLRSVTVFQIRIQLNPNPDPAKNLNPDPENLESDLDPRYFLKLSETKKYFIIISFLIKRSQLTDSMSLKRKIML